MKPSKIAAMSAAAFSLSFIASERSLGQATDPVSPGGVLSAYPTVVQTGTKPTLSWNILYPSILENLVKIIPPGTLQANEALFCTVQIIGAGESIPGTAVATDLRLSVNGGSYKQLFYGKQANVNPTSRLYIKKLSAGQKIDLGGRYVKPDGSWSEFFTTRSSNLQAVSLANGSTPPTTFPLHLQATLTNSLKPYLDAAGKVKIGPLSVLILMELNKTDRTNPGFDLQDQIALVTFSRKHPGNGNNGNGNNLDGVDSSNPGNGSGGPNGAIDPSGGYDDER